MLAIECSKPLEIKANKHQKMTMHFAASFFVSNVSALGTH